MGTETTLSSGTTPSSGGINTVTIPSSDMDTGMGAGTTLSSDMGTETTLSSGTPPSSDMGAGTTLSSGGTTPSSNDSVPTTEPFVGNMIIEPFSNLTTNTGVQGVTPDIGGSPF